MKRPYSFFSLALTLLLISCTANESAVVGTLERHRLALRAPVSQPVLKWHVAEGEQVSAGQLLVTLDPAVANAQLAAATAQLEQAQARLAEWVRGPRQESIQQARAAVDEAQAQLDRARDELQRIEPLVEQNLLSEAELNQAQAAKQAAAARVQSAQAALAAQLEGTTAEQLAQARAAVAAAKAQREQARIARDRLLIQAPVAGVVEALPFRIGERPPAHAPVAILLAAEPVYARVYIPASLRTELQLGDTAVIHLAGSDKTVPGVIRYIASDAAYTPYYALTEYDRGHLTWLAEIDVAASAESLPTGLPVTVTFPDSNEHNKNE